MKSIALDKIASVTLHCRLSTEVRLATRFLCQEGDVVAVRVLTHKSTQNQLELVSGRLHTLQPGDVFAGCLGHRRALLGYTGHVPKTLEPGHTLQLLNAGGVLGICDSFNPDLGRPIECEALGQVLSFRHPSEPIGVPANIGHWVDPALLALGTGSELRTLGVPVLAVVGTGMYSGKTTACARLIRELTRAGRTVHAAKCSGESLRRDVLAMEDAGAAKTLHHTDLGAVTTSRTNSAALTHRILEALCATSPAAVVLELGDGLLGDCGVDAIFEDAQLRACLRTIVLAATDPVGAWGGVKLLEERYGLRPVALTGPLTDNIAGTEFVQQTLGLAAHNARVAPHKLAETVAAALFHAASTSGVANAVTASSTSVSTSSPATSTPTSTTSNTIAQNSTAVA